MLDFLLIDEWLTVYYMVGNRSCQDSMKIASAICQAIAVKLLQDGNFQAEVMGMT
jgi:hypothetical protein